MLTPLVSFEGGPLSLQALPILTFGSGTFTINNESLISGKYSGFITTGDGTGFAALIGSFRDQSSNPYIQLSIRLPSDLTINDGEFFVFALLNNTDDTNAVTLGIYNDSGDYKLILICNTGSQVVPVTLALETVYNLQFYVVVDNADGEIHVWINNDVEGSPTYSWTSIDTGSFDIYQFIVAAYDPLFTSPFSIYVDNINADTVFHSPFTIPQRLSNLNDNPYDPTNPHVIYAEYINVMLDLLGS